jgi:excinuclease ABC subunit B
MRFNLKSKFQPTGDQPQAIEQLSKGVLSGVPFQTLLGITGSGKTFTIANVIQNIQKPTLVISHNKTLAAQLASELKEFFPNNAVHYFVSYYDYYQPEAYIPKTDTFIEKQTMINEEIDQYRLAATASLLTRKDVIIVASVSCIYGLGPQEDYQSFFLTLEKGTKMPREEIFQKLIAMQYVRSTFDFKHGMFEVLGDVIEIYPATENFVVRLEMFDDEIEKIALTDPITGEIQEEKEKVILTPAKHYVTSPEKIKMIVPQILAEMRERVEQLKKCGKELEAHRLQTRTEYDMEILQETGTVNGIENYSRYFDGRNPGDPPSTLIDYFPKDYLLIIDESHMTIPQIGGMYNGDRSRKLTLIEHGFRLPSALDNRPLRFEEFEQKLNQVIFVSATPAPWELQKSKGHVIEQILRPTGLLDPMVEVRPTKHQIDDIIHEIKERTKRNERVLITTLTKKSAEDLTDYLSDQNIRVRYLHSDIDTIDRLDIIKDLRLGKFDVLIGINLLREGLDLPEVSLILILDADKQGFLRSETALIQTIGRASRNANGTVILYADNETAAMKKAIEETMRRRKKQEAYNKAHGIIPTTIVSSIKDIGLTKGESEEKKEKIKRRLSEKERRELIAKLELEMDMYAANLEFEKAAIIRDQIEELRQQR